MSTVLEIATLHITPGHEGAFVEAYRQGRPLLAELDSCHSVRMTRGIETPTRFVLIVEWDSVEAHENDFRASDRFTRWRELIGPHFAEPPHVEHYLTVE